MFWKNLMKYVAIPVLAVVTFFSTPNYSKIEHPKYKIQNVEYTRADESDISDVSTDQLRIVDTRLLTEEDDYSSEPKYSPDGKRIAYVNGDNIWLMDSDGKNKESFTRTLHTGFYFSDPTWCPEGGHIAYTDHIGGGRSLITVHQVPDLPPPCRHPVSGRYITPLTNIEEQPDAYNPDWSPDGKSIIYVSGNDIWSISPDYTGERNLTKTKNIFESPSWSPDGKNIAFSSYELNGQDNQFKVYGIYNMDSDGKNRRKLTNGFEPSWSPDGKKIVYMNECDIWIIDCDGDNNINLTNTKNLIERNPSWSPDGRKIIFSLYHIIDNDGKSVIYAAELGKGETPPFSNEKILQFIFPDKTLIPMEGRYVYEVREGDEQRIREVTIDSIVEMNFDGDKDNEIAVLVCQYNPRYHYLTILENKPYPYKKWVRVDEDYESVKIYAHDFNHDGINELIEEASGEEVFSHPEGSHRFKFKKLDIWKWYGGFDEEGPYEGYQNILSELIEHSPTKIDFKDINNDGFDDVVFRDIYGTTKTSLWTNNGFEPSR